MSDLPVPSVAVVVRSPRCGARRRARCCPRGVPVRRPGGEAWHARCPGGHPLRGWLGRARCGQCAPRGEGAGGAGDAGSEGNTGREADVTRGDGERATGTSYHTGPVAPAAVTALVCAALAAATGTRPELAVWLLLAPVGVLLAVVDFRVQRLPDPLTLPFAAAALALLGVVALVPEHAGTWTTALLGALALAPATSPCSSSTRPAWASAT
ncbi:hypothetical protein SHIRM173S_10743 [Streptomyces hirsutus]